MSQMSLVMAERARQNRAYVRVLLRQRQPGFAVALASAEQDLSCQGPGLSQPLTCSVCNMPRVELTRVALQDDPRIAESA
jgi:hypothetical protein